MKLRTLLLSGLALIIAANSHAQLLQWNTFGNSGSETTEPSVFNDPNITASSLTFGAGVTAAANLNRFGASGWFDTGDTNPTTLAESISGNDFIQFTVTPNAGFIYTPTSFVFQWDRSTTGPQDVALRSSADGYTTNLGTILGIVESTGSFATNTITISGLSNIATATTFRIYGYNATAVGGTGGFDTGTNAVNVTLNGTTASAGISTAQSGDWYTGTTWVGGVVPTSTQNAIVAHSVTASAPITRNAGTTTTVNLLASLAMTGATYTNNGATTINGTFRINTGAWATGNNFVYGGAGILNFSTSNNYNVNATDVFWPVTSGPFSVNVLQAGLTINASRTINGIFSTGLSGGAFGINIVSPAVLTLNGTCRIDPGGFFSNAPVFGIGSTLIYNTGGTYGRGFEWSALGVGTAGVTPGYPWNVRTSLSGTELNYTNGTPLAKAMGGSMTVDVGTFFYMDFGFVTAGGPLTVGGNVSVAGILSLGFASGDDLKMAGNLSFTGTGTLSGNSRAIFFTKNGAQTISSVQPLTIPYVIFAPISGSTTIQLLSNLFVSGNISGNAVQFSNAADIFDINGNTLTIGTIGVGNAISGIGTFKGSTTSNLTIQGLGSIGNIGFTTGFQNLGTFKTDREAGLVSCVLVTPVTVSTSLNLAHGLINLGNNAMTLGSTATTTGGLVNDSYVIADVANGGGAALLKTFLTTGASQSFVFPIGDMITSANGSEYSPVTITFPVAATFSGLSAGFAVFDLKEPNLDANTDFITRYWKMTSLGTMTGTYSLGATYYATDVVGAEGNTRSNQWNGTAWLNNGTISAANTLTITNVATLPAVNHFTKGFRNSDINIKETATSTVYLTASLFTFPTIAAGSFIDVTFTIENLGQQSLSFTAATVSGAAYSFNPVFTLAPTVLGPSGTRTFTIRFAPAIVGTFTGSVSFTNNDPNESPYVINFTGGGAIPASDINVLGAGNTLTTTNTPLSFTDTFFAGQIVTTTSAPKTYTIQNLGNIPLNISSVVLTGANSGDFTISAAPAASVAAGSSTTLSITFTPTAGGTRTATVTIASNDPDEANYIFFIAGTGQEPEIEILGFGTTIVDGTTTVSTTNSTQFGNVNVASGLVAKTFTIYNTGALLLSVSSVTLSGAGAGDFSITTTPAISVGSSTSTTLVITFNPSSVGVKDATVTIINNDATENPFTFALQGNGIDYIECGLGAFQTIAVQDFEVAAATPTLSYTLSQESGAGVAIAAGGQARGASRTISSNKFIGARSFQVAGHLVNSGTELKTTVNFATIDASAYQEVSLNFKLGGYSTTNVQGPDTSPEKVSVSISTNNGVTWSEEMSISGNGNSIWDVNSSTGSFTGSFDGNNIAVVGSAFSGSTNTGPRNITLSNLPSSSQLKVRIVFSVDRLDELWVIDDVVLQGKTAAVTTWNGFTWSAGAPTAITKAIINGNYNTTPDGNLQACECQVNVNFTLNVSTGNYLEIQSNITNNGTLNIADDASLVQVNNSAVNTGTGIVNVTKTTSAYNKFDYTYWSSPNVSNTIGATFSLWRTDYAFQFVTANYADVIAPINGFDDDSNAWQNVAIGTVMTPGKGYAIMAPTTGTFPATSTVIFSGAVNNGIVSIPLVLSANGASATDDFNLVGNPYPSSIYANDFINTNTNFAGTLYFWTHRTGISGANPGPDANNFITTDYAMYNLSGGISSGTGSPVPTGYVASGQGFFIDAQTATNLVFNNAMRSKLYNNANFYRVSNNQNTVAEPSDRIWLNLENEGGLFSQQLVGYFQEASNGFDRGYDGVVSQTSNTVSFYSLMEDEKYRIQGRQPFSDSDLVPLGYASNITGNFTINIDHAEGVLNSAGTNVYLEDKLLNIIHDLEQSSYTFSTAVGIFNDRFVLRYSNAMLGTIDAVVDGNMVIAYVEGANIIVKSESELLKSITIHDIAGRILYQSNKCDSNEVIVDQLSSGRQALIISIVTESGRKHVKKLLF